MTARGVDACHSWDLVATDVMAVELVKLSRTPGLHDDVKARALLIVAAGRLLGARGGQWR